MTEVCALDGIRLSLDDDNDNINSEPRNQCLSLLVSVVTLLAHVAGILGNMSRYMALRSNSQIKADW